MIPEEFDSWYAPQQEALKNDPLLRYFVEARNELEKQGRLNVSTSASIKSFSSDDIKKFGRPPVGARAFFIGDQLGGTGWEVELADGTKEKYYVELPASIGEVKQHFANFPAAKAPELHGATVEDLCQRYLERLGQLVASAREHFLGDPPREKSSHLRVVK